MFSVLGVDARRRDESSEEDEDGSGRSHKWPFKKPQKPPVYVKTEAGVVRGYVSRLAGRDKPVNVFKGVPYAEPPLGELRFRKLQKKRMWKGVWNATEYSPACLSNTTRTTSPQNNTDEDCLYVNIFAGKRCSERNKCAVLFYVHGGAFDYDSAVMFNDTQIIRKYASDDIVFVIPAYRLGVFGFLDLGNDDTVPRNLGLHDIIFSLKWAQRELEGFGGDPKRMTLFGNSAGATAIQMLCISPAVPKTLFKQAFISSGEPLLLENVNEVPTREILNEFGCLYDKINKNRTLGDEEKVDCLRRVPALDLLEAQRWFEDERGLLFGGLETDTELLPGKSFAELLPKWKPRTAVFSVVLNEFENRGENMSEECYKDMAVFGYKSKAAFNACLAKYGNITEEDEYLPISADTFHAEAYIQAYVNALKGGDSYLLSFDLENHTLHANDLTFFFGLHAIQGRNMTPEEKLMDEYYPEMVKRFLRTGKPAKDWQPLDRNGSNYYVLEFSVENDTIVEQPHPVSDYYDPEALKFWLTDMANIERDAEEAENSTSLPWRPAVGNWPFPKGREHDYDWLTPRPHHRPSAGSWPFPKGKEHDYDWLTPRPHYRPSAGSWPFPKGKEHDYDWLTPRPHHRPSAGSWPFPKGKERDYDWLTPQPPLQLHQLPPVGRWPIVKTQRPPYWAYLNRLNLMAQPSETVASPEQAVSEIAARNAEDSLPIREVWSAFWLMMSLAILLTAVILLMVSTRLVYRFKNVRGYSYNYDDGLFTEKTKIITVGNNGTRYT